MLCSRFSRFVPAGRAVYYLETKAHRWLFAEFSGHARAPEDLYKHKLVDFIITFLEEIDSEISYMKIGVWTRGRASWPSSLLQRLKLSRFSF